MEEKRMNTIKFCLKCGHPIGPDDKFCLGCGANIAEMQAQQGAAATPAPEPNTQAQQPEAQPQQNFQQPQNNFQQPQNNFQQPQNNFGGGFAQPQPGFGAPAAAVKTGDNWFKKNLKLIIIIASVLVVGLIAFFVIKHVFFRFQVIDAKDLYKIEFKGIDTAGTCTPKLNKYSDSVYNSEYAGALSDLMDNEDSENAVSKYFEVSEKRLLAAYTKAGNKQDAVKMRTALLSEAAGLEITINGEKTAKGLKNGDTVKCVVTYNEQYLKDNDIKLENTEFEVTVADLKTGTKVTMFDNVNVKFSGMDGNGIAEYEVDSSSETSRVVRYSWKESYRNLKNGDKVVLVGRLRYASLVDENDPNGAVYSQISGNYYTADKASEEKEYTVEGLGEMKKINIFDGVKLEFRNASPYLRVTKINTDGCPSEVQSGVRFYLDDSSKDYKIGDTVRLKAYVRSSFTNSGFAPDGTPDADGYYYGDVKVPDDAPVYLTKDNAPGAVDKFAPVYSEIIKKITDEGVERTYVRGFSAGSKISGMTFKETKTMLYEYNEATGSSYRKCLIVKSYVVSVATENETKTAYAYIALRNPVITGDSVSYDENSAEYYLYDSQERLDRKLDDSDYTITSIKGAAEQTTTKATEEGQPSETQQSKETEATEKKPEETTTTKAAEAA